jgi:hypothetical protein
MVKSPSLPAIRTADADGDCSFRIMPAAPLERDLCGLRHRITAKPLHNDVTENGVGILR